MRYVLKAEDMKYYDGESIKKGLPAMVLMERAAVCIVYELKNRIKKGCRVLVAAGGGNNGGDGLAVGRILAEQGAEVSFCMTGSNTKISSETQAQIKILKNYGFSIQSKIQNAEYDIVIDALFGIGLSREITGEFREVITVINKMHDSGAYVCAVDIPSGIHSDTGKIMGCAVKADKTVTFQAAKAGHYFYPGKEYTGTLAIRDIGIRIEIKEHIPSYFTFDEEADALMPERSAAGNKGIFGKVLLIAGSPDMCGACELCGESILRSGAGMLKIITHGLNREILQIKLPEAMLYTYTDMPDIKEIDKAAGWADILIIGPGLGQGKAARLLIEHVLKTVNKPLVIDADGLNLIAAEKELEDALKSHKGNELILTPHPGELIRLAHLNRGAYENDREKLIRELTERFKCVLAGKDAATVAAAYDKKIQYLNTSGNDGMATAGSGDVLTGIIGGLLAQGMPAFEAACTGIYLHGLSGDYASAQRNRYSMIASDILEAVSCVLKDNKSTGKEE